MTHLVERLAELRRHLEHLKSLRPKVEGPDHLRRDLSLHNDVLFSLLTVCQLVIDIAGELSARKALRFESYTEAVRNLSAYDGLPPTLVEDLARLPGFRNVVLHDYVTLDFERVIAALDGLQSVESFAEWLRRLESEI